MKPPERPYQPLPPDVITYILCLCQAVWPAMLPISLGWIRLTQVCRQWRRVASASGQLWASTVSHLGQNLDAFRWALECAGELPVELDVDRIAKGSPTEFMVIEEEVAACFLAPEVLARAGSIISLERRLVVGITDRWGRRLAETDTYHGLVSLCLALRSSDTFPVFCAPKLEQLCLISEIDSANPEKGAVTIDTILEIWSQSPLLSELELVGCLSGEVVPASVEKWVPAPRQLEHMTLDEWDGRFLRAISTLVSIRNDGTLNVSVHSPWSISEVRTSFLQMATYSGGRCTVMLRDVSYNLRPRWGWDRVFSVTYDDLPGSALKYLKDGIKESWTIEEFGEAFQHEVMILDLRTCDDGPSPDDGFTSLDTIDAPQHMVPASLLAPSFMPETVVLKAYLIRNGVLNYLKKAPRFLHVDARSNRQPEGMNNPDPECLSAISNWMRYLMQVEGRPLDTELTLLGTGHFREYPERQTILSDLKTRCVVVERSEERTKYSQRQ